MNLENLNIEKKIEIIHEDALIIVDMQNDFIPGGSLPVEKGNEIVDGINHIAENFRKNKGTILLTQDWHPKEHLSFASNHPGMHPGDTYQSEAIGPVLWPDHCIQNTYGSEFSEDLKKEYAHAIIRKGYRPEIDSYSGFIENDKKSETGLAGYLKSLNIKRIFICGLALDYCCYATAMDGIDFGFQVYFILDLTKGIDIPKGNISNALKTMKIKGIRFVLKESFT
jgi:nicotinamidase/pyrazinamidase